VTSNGVSSDPRVATIKKKKWGADRGSDFNQIAIKRFL
jgi:hypothetical protein